MAVNREDMTKENLAAARRLVVKQDRELSRLATERDLERLAERLTGVDQQHEAERWVKTH